MQTFPHTEVYSIVMELLHFSYILLQLREGAVIFTSGGDISTSYGLAMWFSGGRVYLRVSTSTREWTVFTTDFQLNIFVNIKFSWSVQTGLVLFFTDRRVAFTEQFVKRTRVDIKRTEEFLVGTTVDKTHFTPMEIEGFEIAYCPVDTLEKLEVVVGQFIFCFVYHLFSTHF